jgi:hypothetical protein
MSAPAPLSAIAAAGWPSSLSVSMSRPGAVAAACSAALVSALSRFSSMMSATPSRLAEPWPVLADIRGSSAAAETIRSGASCSTASRAAQLTARSDSSDPSVAATMGFTATMSSSSDPDARG